MSRKGEFDWRAHKRDWEYKKYGGYLDPEDEDVFFGPVTVRELKKSIEVGDAIVKKAREKKKATSAAVKENLENIDESEMNRTFEVSEPSKNTEFNTTFEIDDTLKHSAKEDSNRSCVSSAVREPLKDISHTKTFLSTFENLELGDTLHNVSNISTNSAATLPNKKGCLIDETFPEFVQTHLPTPLIDKMPRFVTKTPVKKDSLRLESGTAKTPRVTRMSSTPITAMLAKDILYSSPEENALETANDTHQNTPEVFRQKTNEIWKKEKRDISILQKTVADNSFKSKLPKVKQTPIKDKYFFAKSPVADYIHNGVDIKSMSKLRHDNCMKVDVQVKSKSDHKGGKPCKIPLPTFGTVKRKLNLETKTASTTATVRKMI